MKTTEVFAKNVQEIRLSKGITQQTLANLSGFSTVYISQMERAMVNANLTIIERLSKGLQVPAWRLLWSR
ncbi:MAG: helix-turn-helix transcriptional regulator [Proteobacteria bacterium]|nr:helix-turn-helix transcriptional regulator [Pseudomonadota bacterium]